MFLRSQSPAPEQLTFRTHGPQLRVNAEKSVANAREANREQRKKRAEGATQNGVGDRWALARKARETAPTLAFRAKKIPTDKSWDFKYWWGGVYRTICEEPHKC